MGFRIRAQDLSIQRERKLPSIGKPSGDWGNLPCWEFVLLLHWFDPHDLTSSPSASSRWRGCRADPSNVRSGCGL